MMKKIIFIGTSLLFLTACGDEEGTTQLDVTHGSFEEGTYNLMEQNYDENGWRAEFSIEVVDDEIITSDYNEYNEDGTAKTEDETYQQMMFEANGVGPQEYVEELNNQLVETQDAAQIDIVSGATASSEKFQEYSAMLLNAAENGSVNTIEVDN